MQSYWLDIDSAPKDGTRFWGKVDDDAIAMLWHEHFGEFVSDWREMQFSASYGGGKRLHHPTIYKPKFWMPLPPAPTSWVA